VPCARPAGASQASPLLLVSISRYISDLRICLTEDTSCRAPCLRRGRCARLAAASGRAHRSAARAGWRRRRAARSWLHVCHGRRHERRPARRGRHTLGAGGLLLERRAAGAAFSWPSACARLLIVRAAGARQAAAPRGATRAEDDELRLAFETFCAQGAAAQPTEAAPAHAAAAPPPARCQIPGCGASLAALRPYNKRAKCASAAARRAPACGSTRRTTHSRPPARPPAAPGYARRTCARTSASWRTAAVGASARCGARRA
jgi:hypothetical protein